jgi:lipopolysaccharide/colanic/teichoic acid biosynthesis glycosyltransferase
MIRFFDILFSLLGLIILIPIFLVIGLLVYTSSKGGVFYIQERIGRFGIPFMLYKFRSMPNGSDQNGLLTVGKRDSRLTTIGYFIRQYKLDELPQLWNVLIGDMSLVGPRPEVERYTSLYSAEQSRVLSIRPGITDPASIYYRKESELLANSPNPEETYIREIMPHKLSLSLQYINQPTVFAYFRHIINTIVLIFK